MELRMSVSMGTHWEVVADRDRLLAALERVLEKATKHGDEDIEEIARDALKHDPG
jgi:hypothetical protein